MARYGLFHTPHGHGDDGHGNELSQQVRALAGRKGEGRWPTPTSAAAVAGPDYGGRDARPESGGPNLITAVLFEDVLEHEREVWPTATTRDWKDTGDSIANGTVGVRGLLGRAVGPSREAGSLNPAWVEWLMGFPIGWTDLTVEEPEVLAGEPWPADPHPRISRLTPRIPRRKNRLQQLGNAVVPAVAEVVGRRALDLLKEAE